jgi:hypothetical protein
MYYSSGNYEAFARPRKPQGVESKSAWFVGSGLAALAGAAFLIRDGQMAGNRITILEQQLLPGGALDGIKEPEKGFVIRGGREMEEHFECLWDLYCWSLRQDMTRDIVIDALRMAWFKRHPSKQAGLIFHSDRGSQYASKDFRDVLTEYGITASMSRRGNCWDNTCSETLFGSLKVERLHGQRFKTRRQAKDEVVAWMLWYNRSRLHSTLAYVSPMRFEENWLVNQPRQVSA